MKIFIIGSGNIASHLSKAFKKNAIGISGVYARDEKKGRAIAKKYKSKWYSALNAIPNDSDVYLICVSDEAIKIVANQLPLSIQTDKIIAHTSGCESMEGTLLPAKNIGIFYPLQTFTKGKKLSYKNIPICINGSNKMTIKTLTALGEKISTSVQFINDNQRKSIHLSGVMINNFVNHLIYIAQTLLEKDDIPPIILQPLLLETISKQKELGAYDAQTGPARRLDAQTLATHLDLLTSHKEYKAIYMNISKSIQKTYNPKK